MAWGDVVEEFHQPDERRARGARYIHAAWNGLRFLYTNNPFYLLSTAFVLHGSARWMQNPHGYDAWLLIGLVGAYVLMMAVTAIVIVRAGGVWEDARTILFLVPVLLVELSLTLDSLILSDRSLGPSLSIVGFVFAWVVCEALLRGLRIRFPIHFSGPLSLFLVLLFLYPQAIVTAIYAGQVSTAHWSIFGFSWASAFVTLSLIPAVRRGRDLITNNGTPWQWPWFPWSLIVVCLVGLCVRSYSLCLSFDPALSLNFNEAMQLSSIWTPGFLSPFVLAASVLLLEFGLAEKNHRVQISALAGPMMSVLLALPWSTSSSLANQFRHELTAQLGSPHALMLVMSVAFYGVAWWRNVRWAEPLFIICLFLMIGIPAEDMDAPLLRSLHEFKWVLAPSVLIAAGLWKCDSRRLFAGTMVLIPILDRAMLSYVPGWVRGFVWTQFVGLSVFSIGRHVADSFGARLRRAAALLLAIDIVTALLLAADPPPAIQSWAFAVYAALLVLLVFAAAYSMRNMLYFGVGVGGVIAVASERIQCLFDSLSQTHRDANSFLVAAIFFLIAVGVSTAKAGWGKRLSVLLPTPKSNP